MPETRIRDYLSFLQDLGASGLDYFLEGGQAVNFWAEYFSAKGAKEVLSPFIPFASKDCDVWASYTALQYIRSKGDGCRFLPNSSPADGQVGIVILEGAPERKIDIMTSVYGIAQSRMKQLKERSLVIGGIRVIDPIRLFQSKCHCLLGLDQSDRQDKKHLQILCLLVPEHIEGLLGEVMGQRLSQRNLINELKILQKILKTNRVKRAIEQIGVDPISLMPVKPLMESELAKVVRFVESTYSIAE